MATIISLVKAQSLIQEYQQQNSAPGGPGLLTPTTQFLNGYFIDKASILDMMNNPNIAGISIYLAKDANFVGSTQNVFNLVAAGVVPNTGLGFGGASYVSAGNLYSDVPPCPTTCATLI